MNEVDHSSSIRSQLGTFLVILSGGFVTMLNVSILNVALPSMGHSLHAEPSHLQWIVAGYSLAFGLIMIPGGRFGDMFGRKRLFVIGLGTFALSSLLCGIAPNPQFLVAMRLFQGFFAGLISPQVTGLIQQIFSGKTRATAYGLFGMSIGVSTAIGPVIGGLLVSGFGDFGWRLCFLVNIPVCLLIIPFAAKLLPGVETQVDKDALEMDLGGMVIIGVFVLFSMLPFLHASKDAQSLSNLPWSYLIVAAVALALFFAWELWREHRNHSVIMPKSLRRNIPFIQGMSLSTMFFAGWSGLFIVYTLYLQEGLGLPAWLAGTLQIPIAVGAGVTSSMSGRWVGRWGAKVVTTGLVVCASGLGATVVVINTAAPGIIPWLLVVTMLITGMGSGLTISPNQSLTLSQVPAATGGTAGGLLQTVQRVGTSVGIAMSTLVFFFMAALTRENIGTNATADAQRQIYTAALTGAGLLIVFFIVVALAISLWGLAVEKKWGGINAPAPSEG